MKAVIKNTEYAIENTKMIFCVHAQNIFLIIHIAYLVYYQSKPMFRLIFNLQCSPVILAPVVYISKSGCENTSILFIFLI